jgi:Arc/MetJ-type ribon-helix-helix transcriptional regulator
MARGPQIRVSVSQAFKDHVEETAARLGYPSAAEFVREALLFRLALLAIQENREDVEAAEALVRRLLEPGR